MARVLCYRRVHAIDKAGRVQTVGVLKVEEAISAPAGRDLGRRGDCYLAAEGSLAGVVRAGSPGARSPGRELRPTGKRTH